jgi:hypothetical protein
MNNWYSTLDVDLSNKECSYGCNLTYDFWDAYSFGKRVFKCYFPINQKNLFWKK